MFLSNDSTSCNYVLAVVRQWHSFSSAPADPVKPLMYALLLSHSAGYSLESKKRKNLNLARNCLVRSPDWRWSSDGTTNASTALWAKIERNAARRSVVSTHTRALDPITRAVNNRFLGWSNNWWRRTQKTREWWRKPKCMITHPTITVRPEHMEIHYLVREVFAWM